MIVIREISDIHHYVGMIRQQRMAKDFEAASSTRTRLYEGVLRAIRDNRVRPQTAARAVLPVARLDIPDR